jgi:hypothetical protein
MKIVASALIDKPNEWFLEKWCEFHSKYCERLILKVDNLNKEDLEPSTYDMLKKYPVDVSPLGFEWHEGKARTELLKATLLHDPDWICVCDSDEIFSDNFLLELDSLFNDTSVFWYSFPFFNFWKDLKHIRIDGAWGFHMRVLKIFRNTGNHNFTDKEYHVLPYPEGINALNGKYLEHIKLKNCGWGAENSVENKSSKRGAHYREAVVVILDNVILREVDF